MENKRQVALTGWHSTHADWTELSRDHRDRPIRSPFTAAHLVVDVWKMEMAMELETTIGEAAVSVAYLAGFLM